MLFAEIARECGREVPTGHYLPRSNDRGVGFHVGAARHSAVFSFIRLKGGKEHPPILITHGLGGRARFSELAKHIHTAHPIYGVQARGIDGREEPFDRIEDMAEFYLEALKELQPEGPYLLIGYSFGGLVALEWPSAYPMTARRLGFWCWWMPILIRVRCPGGSGLRLSLQRSMRHVSEMRRRPVPEAISYFTADLSVDSLSRDLRVARLTSCPRISAVACADNSAGQGKSLRLALARYQPRPYAGKIKFVKSESDEYFPGDPVPFGPMWPPPSKSKLSWNSPGYGHEHTSPVLAAVLTRYLKESLLED